MTTGSLPTRTLGRTGLEVTMLGYGAMSLDARFGRTVSEDEARTVLNAVLDAGINFIDTSPDYGPSEELIGATIAGRRDEYVLASKCGCPVAVTATEGERPGHVYTAENIVAGVEQSLRRIAIPRQPVTRRPRGARGNRDAAQPPAGRQGALHRHVRDDPQTRRPNRHGRLR
jgi:hypothetical protein